MKRTWFLTRYGKVFRDPGRPGWSLVFSTLSGSLVRLQEGLVEALREGTARLPEGDADALQRAGVLVEVPEAERARAVGYLEEVNRVSPVFVAAVIVGMECNFGCPYCYEGPDKGDRSMDLPTARALARFLAARVEGPGMERLIVDFYGGEPLVYESRVVLLSGLLSEECARRDVRFESTLVTNGSLLNPGVLDRLVPLGLKAVKVTLDGPPDVHDRSRPYKNGSGSFWKIVRNLKACAGRVPVGITVNITRDTWRRAPELLDVLVSEGLGPGQIAQVMFSPVIGKAGGCAGCVSAGEAWLAEAAATLHREACRRGYPPPELSPSPCMADLDHAITVNWDGSLTRCPALVNRPEFVVGAVPEGITARDDPFRVSRWEHREECRACEYLPLCFGGCRYMALLRTGGMAEVDCQRSFWDGVLETLVVEQARTAARPPHAGSGTE